MDRILSAPQFTRSPKLSHFLRLVVEQTLNGEGHLIKERVIGIDVFGRDPDYDPKSEPIVRTEARRLRRKLEEFYEKSGLSGGIRITLPTGGYAPEFEFIEPSVLVDSQSPALPPVTSPRPRWVFAVLSAASVLAVIYFALSATSAKHLEPARSIYLTTLSGYQTHPSLSPDGSQVAFAGSKDTEPGQHIYIAMTSGGTIRQLTTGEIDSHPAWSPDGSWIAFQSGRDILVVPPLGGQPRKIAESGHPMLAWSADSRWLAIGVQDPGSPTFYIRLISVETGEQRRLTFPQEGTLGDTNVSFSPDGTHYAVQRCLSDGCDLFTGSLDSRDLQPLTHDRKEITGFAWTPDGRRVIFASNRGGFYDLWEADPFRHAETLHIAGAGGAAGSPSVSRGQLGRGIRIVYEEAVRDINLWSTNLKDPGARPVKIVDSTRTESSPSLSNDGGQMVYVSDRTGGEDLWLANPDGSNERQLTRLGACGSPKWSPDGSSVAFDRLVGLDRAIHVVDVRTGAVRQITAPHLNQGRPSWSADGRFIYYFAPEPQSNRNEIWKIPADADRGRPGPVQITHGGGFEGFETADGKDFDYVRSASEHTVWRIRANDSPAEVFGGVRHGYWRVARNGIYFVESESFASPGPKRVMFFDFATRRATQVASLAARFFIARPDFAVDPAGERLVWAQIDEAHTNLRLLDLPD